MSSKLERELEEIIQKTGGPRPRSASSDFIRNVRWTFYAVRNTLLHMIPARIRDTSLMPVGFLVLVAGLLVRLYSSTIGTSLLLSGVGLVMFAYFLYIFKPSKKRTGWRGKNLNRR